MYLFTTIYFFIKFIFIIKLKLIIVKMKSFKKQFFSNLSKNQNPRRKNW